MNTIIISEKSPVLFDYFVLVNALARMRACTISWKNQCSRNFGKFIKQNMQKRPTLKPDRKRPSRNYPRPETYVYSTTHCTEKLPRDGCKQTISSAPWVPPVQSGVRLVLLVYSKESILVESLSNYIYNSSWIYWKENGLCLSVS